MTRYAQALEAFHNGCNNSEDVAEELKVSKAHASVLITQLRRDRMIRDTGRRCPRKENNNGMTSFVYELVS